MDIDPASEPGAWVVVVEETGGGNEGRWWGVSSRRHAPDQAAARQLAVEFAAQYEPIHPRSPQGRTIYRQGDDTWLVHVQGMMQNFHFRVSVMEYVATLDSSGQIIA